ncbi:MAG: 3-dehydroquinate synthase [Anaerolineales bacterium]|nr:3-dehydroquinate synthase [Anaerolineales bacterium]
MTRIFFYGPPASGKTSVGRIVAQNLRLPFVDLDRRIESDAGMSIPQIMAQRGESAFRDLETSALKALIENESEYLVALGGGALLREENRALAESGGKILLLDADLQTLFERAQRQPNERPLLTGELKSKLEALMKKRAAHYASFAPRLRVDGKSAKQNAFEAQVLLGRHRLSAMGAYDVIVDSLFKIPNLNNPLIVSDENVAAHHLEKVQNLFGAKAVVIPAGEEHKNLQTVSRLWKSFLENGLDRKSTVVALGGGVVSDLSGFAAATYMRGIDWVALPSTLLAMADASLGGKTGFDLPEGKNLIGAFHPPKVVVADVRLLQTLPERELISGMAEVVKHGIISDPELFELCNNGLDWVKDNLEEVVKRAMAVKIKVIEEDPYEKGIRAALNLGHTVGHAVELVSQFELRHGEAIAIGMAVEARYAARIGRTSPSAVEAIESALTNLGLPIRIPENLAREEIIRAMRVDKKKSAASVRFALPVEIGKVELVEAENLDEVIP